MERRYGDDAQVLYHDVASEESRSRFSEVIGEIEARGLMYPVTSVDNVLVYDGAVSYPAIMRAVHNKLLDKQEPTSAS